MSIVIKKFKIFVKRFIQSADEKLRSLSHKGHNSSKTNSNTYCGAQNGQSGSPGGAPLTPSRSEAPDVPPPPIPHVTTNQIQQNQSHDPKPHHESANQIRSSVILETTETEIPPPIYPKPHIIQMAERRFQRSNRKSGTQEESALLKKRSRSEGPHGRRKLRNSMHETSNKVSQNKSTSNGRHSMYSGHLSDDNNVEMLSGSDSPDSDIADQRWTKNPLMVRKSRKSDRTSKTDKRRSVHNVENRNGNEQSGPNSYQISQNRDFFIHPRKPDSLQGPSQKAKFQRMEENRKKRIDMAVTSDEECSPQLRISRLRQRAMMSSNLDDNQRYEGNINIVPVRDETSAKAFQDFQNGISQFDKSGRNRVSQYDENRQSKYDENYNVNGKFCNEYTRQQGVKHNKLPNVLPEFLPENRAPANMANRGYHSTNIDHVTKNVASQNQNIQSVQPKQEKQTRQRGVKLSSESPKLRSFNEVKANQPTQLKKADQKIELNPRSPNSSSDSLDDLIESNIQYLESEIESGKLKRQSGNYSNYSQEKVAQRQVIREPYRTKPGQDEFRSRLQDPRTFVSNKLMSTVTKVEPKVVQKSTVFQQSSSPYSSQFANSRQTSSSTVEHRNKPYSGSATYSPHMQRKTYDINEDLSKSDSHLNALNTNYAPTQTPFQPTKSYAPYPVLNKLTGNITYIQPADNIEEQMQASENGTVPVIDSGMFSDVEYNIEVSERIKKWEKKLTPGELEERHTVLNTIKEYESFSDSNQKDSVPDTPVEVRRELWQLMSPTSNSGVGKLSVNLTRSTSSVSDSNMQEPSSATYFEPKVVSSETNLHRIFRVVNEPKSRRTVAKSAMRVKPSTESDDTINAQSRHRKPAEVSTHTQSLSNVTLSESEIGSNMQQSWPPMAVDSDSGIRKSWRMSRYEDEINELKELVSDNFRDIRKRFDSDMSETDTKRASPVFREPQIQVPVSVPITEQTSSGTSKLTLNIQPVTPTNSRSPVTIRRKLSDQRKENTPPVSPCVPLTPKNERKVPIYRNVPIETKSVSIAAPPPQKRATIPDMKQPSAADAKLTPDVWSPNMESRKGLVSMERVKARTLQTIPFSEDPVWKEIEGLATFEKPDDISKEVNFDEIDELLKLATGGVDNLKAKSKPNTEFDSQMKRLTSSDTFLTPSSAQPNKLMTRSYTPTTHMQVPKEKHRAMSDSTYPPPHSNKHIFTPPTIQPLKLNSKPSKKSSTSALDEVLEDIRATLQKKPLSPKLMKNLDTSESNSSANPSLQSPLTKSSKSFIFPKDIKRAKTETVPENVDAVKSSTATPGYDNTNESWKPPQNEIPPQALQQLANASYIDPEFTQFPYIINGNYHLDPKLLSEKLKSTGLAHDSSDELLANRNKAFSDLPANHQGLNVIKTQPANQINRPETVNQSNPVTHELDQSVDDLRSLAQEVEHKLSQIKSRIVSADEDRLDSILLALRKFAPMTEQKFFNVKFTPNYESEKARRSKLEDALYELEKMYESLDLDDKSLMERASRREESIGYENMQGIKSSTQNSSKPNIPDKSESVEMRRGVPDGSKILRRSQIDEIERQTQNEFEDITKSFQVLLDEVTKQCRTVAQRSSRYSSSDSNLFSPTSSIQQYSSQRPLDEIRQEPPRQQLKLETQSQRTVQDSYNTAIKELESFATGTTKPAGTKAVQSVMYLNLDKSKPSVEKANENQRNANLVSPTRNLDIQIQSKTVFPNKNTSNVSKTSTGSGSSKFVSMATEFFKPAVAKPVTKDTSGGEVKGVNKSSVSLQVELNDAKPQVRGAGRFRKRGNAEHRKSMPAITRNVETQTVETQTESPPTVSEMKEKFEQYRKASLQEMSSDSSPDFKTNRETKNIASVGVGNDVDLSSSDDDDVPLTKSKMRRSLSCPDIVALLEEFNRKEKEKEKKLAKVDKTNAKKGTKSTTPKLVKQRHENKLRFRSLHKDDTKVKQADISASVTSDDGFETPKSKPPVYPVWKYPGQVESQKVESVKKGEQRKHAFASERDFTKTASDTEQDRVFLRTSDQGATGSDERVIRRRSRSFGGEQQDPDERPKSFHELVATFEQNPQRREKIRTSGLRKCVSEDSMFTDLILQKIYHSESDLFTDDKGHRLSGSGLKLALEMKLKN
ncbi:uncharacterized protein LOC123538149 isoform X2 [Mercenaria mercenaria]|uniref:uncharacterized protein LOC123538149 isoform X2 n=1 Tax=Mercenaria mercenaria TaxID=6596 RepID=UPI00234EC48B|nr:uncharacterized protein LOC123538149 isoform X2 [Mercenaria mercenaria]